MANPQIRFKRDDGTEYPEWEEKNLGDIIHNITSVKRIHAEDWRNSGVPFYRAREIVALYNKEPISPLFIDEELYEKFSEISGRIQEGDLLVTGVGTIGIPYLVKKNDRFYFKDGNIIWIQNNGNIDGQYLYALYGTPYMANQLVNMSGKGTVYTYTIENAKNTVIPFPSLEEQQKIAAFFFELDNLISASADEVAALEEAKKGMIQKIFSREIRLKREDGSDYPEWEEDIISNICSIKTGNSNSQDQVKNGKYPFYIRSEVPVKSNRYLFDCEAVLTIGDGNIGKVFHYVNGKFDLHQRVYMMNEFQDNTFAKYFYYFFSAFFYKRAMRLNAKGTVNSVRREMIADMSIQLPCYEEQQKIADFLSSMDDAIAAAKDELTGYRELKRGLLQQMFA